MLVTGLLSGGSVSAAGSAVITVESSSSVSTGASVDLNFYVTPSGANVYSVGANVSLSNLTFQSWSSSGSPFNGFNGVTAGGSAGSTSFTFSASYQGAAAGGSSKVFIGKAVATAGGSAGTASINFSSPEAYDSSIDTMAASAQNRSITITAPVQSCSAGQTGTPPNCTTVQSGGSSSGSSGSSGSTPSNPTTTPNKKSTASVPAASGTPNTADNPAPAQEISEETLSTIFSSGEAEAVSDQPAQEEGEKKKSNTTPLIIGGIAGLALLGMLIGFLKFKNRGSGPSGPYVPPVIAHVGPGGPELPDTTPTLPPTAPIPPAAPPAPTPPVPQMPEVPPVPEAPKGPDNNKPTMIYPQ